MEAGPTLALTAGESIELQCNPSPSGNPVKGVIVNNQSGYSLVAQAMGGTVTIPPWFNDYIQVSSSNSNLPITVGSSQSVVPSATPEITSTLVNVQDEDPTGYPVANPLATAGVNAPRLVAKASGTAPFTFDIDLISTDCSIVIIGSLPSGVSGDYWEPLHVNGLTSGVDWSNLPVSNVYLESGAFSFAVYGVVDPTVQIEIASNPTGLVVDVWVLALSAEIETGSNTNPVSVTNPIVGSGNYSPLITLNVDAENADTAWNENIAGAGDYPFLSAPSAGFLWKITQVSWITAGATQVNINSITSGKNYAIWNVAVNGPPIHLDINIKEAVQIITNGAVAELAINYRPIFDQSVFPVA